VNLRAAMTAALEALEAGDPGEAAAILRSALQRPRRRRRVCDFCGLSFQWPGQLEDHQRFADHEPRQRRSAA
jgi:hypothetical protein